MSGRMPDFTADLGTSAHEPAHCEREGCGKCDAYGDGYARGKAAGLTELIHMGPGDHGVGCKCDRCLVVGAVLKQWGRG